MKKMIVIAISLFLFNIAGSNTNIRWDSVGLDSQKIETDTTSRDTSFLDGELNDSTLLLALKYYEVSDPLIVRGQARLESGHYTSRLCKQYNNFLGLYDSKNRRYFRFKHWTDCIKGYKKYVAYRKREGESHYKFIKRIKYSTNPDYIKHVKRLATS